jgi:hypothetical protein
MQNSGVTHFAYVLPLLERELDLMDARQSKSEL